MDSAPRHWNPYTILYHITTPLPPSMKLLIHHIMLGFILLTILAVTIQAAITSEDQVGRKEPKTLKGDISEYRDEEFIKASGGGYRKLHYQDDSHEENVFTAAETIPQSDALEGLINIDNAVLEFQLRNDYRRFKRLAYWGKYGTYPPSPGEQIIPEESFGSAADRAKSKIEDAKTNTHHHKKPTKIGYIFATNFNSEPQLDVGFEVSEIDKDIMRTDLVYSSQNVNLLNSRRFFLKVILRTAILDENTVGYTQGQNIVVGSLLMEQIAVEDSYAIFRMMLDSTVKNFWSFDKDSRPQFLADWDVELKNSLPDLKAAFDRVDFTSEFYAAKWFPALFQETLQSIPNQDAVTVRRKILEIILKGSTMVGDKRERRPVSVNDAYDIGLALIKRNQREIFNLIERTNPQEVVTELLSYMTTGQNGKYKTVWDEWILNPEYIDEDVASIVALKSAPPRSRFRRPFW